MRDVTEEAPMRVYLLGPRPLRSTGVHGHAMRAAGALGEVAEAPPAPAQRSLWIATVSPNEAQKIARERCTNAQQLIVTVTITITVTVTVPVPVPVPVPVKAKQSDVTDSARPRVTHHVPRNI